MQCLRDAIPLLQDQEVEDWCNNFANYLEATWIRGTFVWKVCLFFCLSCVCPGSFPPQEWNQYDDLEQNFLTNNVIEGMNFRLISRFKFIIIICIMVIIKIIVEIFPG